MDENIKLLDGYLKDILKYFVDGDFFIDFSFKEDSILYFDIKGDGFDFLLKNSGELINAIQYLLVININAKLDGYVKVVLDYKDFRNRRCEYLKNLSEKIVQSVISKKQNITLEPMDPFERKLVHCYISKNNLVYSKSVGVEPNRCVVVYPR